MSSSNTHKERKTDGYSRLLRDLDRLVRWSKDGRWEDVDEVHNEMREWILSQIELSEAMSARGKTGGILSGQSRRSTASSSASTSALTKGEAVLQPVLEAETDLASSNKVINKENELKKRNPPTPLQAPPGFKSSAERFNSSMSGDVAIALEKWASAWRKWKHTEPTIGSLEQRIASENIEYLTQPDIMMAFKWFLTDENAKDFGGHSFKAFCKDPAKWLGKYRDSLPRDRSEELVKLEKARQEAQMETLKKIKKAEEEGKPFDFSTVLDDV